jgi:hypothetical protein
MIWLLFFYESHSSINFTEVKYSGFMKPCKRWVLLIAASILLTLVPTGIAQAKCAGRSLAVSRKTITAGAVATITGSTFYVECDDTAGLRLARLPAQGVRIIFVQGERKTQLATVNADDKLEFSVSVTVPSDAAKGAASFILELQNGERLSLVIDVTEKSGTN